MNPDPDDLATINVAKVIRLLLDEGGGTQRQLARWIDRDGSVITQRLKDGGGSIRIAELMDFAAFFDVDPKMFFKPEAEVRDWLHRDTKRLVKLRQRLATIDYIDLRGQGVGATGWTHLMGQTAHDQLVIDLTSDRDLVGAGT